jgi:hydrogenase expression/formation protein HypE
MATPLPLGKLRPALLRELLARHATPDPRVVVGPRVGEDAAVLDMGDRYLVATTDPITFVTEDFGWYALVVNANDLAVRGATPRWFLATCLLPEGRTSESDVTALFAQLGSACDRQGVALVGGHTEITPGLERPIVVGTMLGEVDRARLVTTGGARPGDVLVLTKGVPLEGTSIIARARADELRARGYDDAWLARARGTLAGSRSCRRRSWPRSWSGSTRCTIRRRGAWRRRCGSSPTQPGWAWSWRPSGSRCWPRGPRSAGSFGLDPLGTIASGALLVALGPTDAGILLHALAREDIEAAFIGRVVPREAGVVLTRGGQPGPLPRFDQDEITRLLA